MVTGEIDCIFPYTFDFLVVSGKYTKKISIRRLIERKIQILMGPYFFFLECLLADWCLEDDLEIQI